MALRRKGFTLVELLVVISIIGMLMALLLPAIQSARESGRRNTCNSNLHNAVTAMLVYEQNKRAFPGYANKIGNFTTPKIASWVVPLLPAYERNDLYNIWLTTTPNTTPVDQNGASSPARQVSVLVCPSAASTLNNPDPLSYVVNGGAMSSDFATPYESSPYGVCFDNINGNAKVSVDFLNAADGTTNTLLIAENNQAVSWSCDVSGALSASPTYLPYVAPLASSGATPLKAATTFIWVPSGKPQNAGPLPTALATLQINGDRAATPVAGDFYHSRPSSNHPGVVMVGFCGGSTRSIGEDIDYKVYTQIMTPKEAAVPNAVIDQTTNGPYLYNEADVH